MLSCRYLLEHTNTKTRVAQVDKECTTLQIIFTYLKTRTGKRRVRNKIATKTKLARPLASGTP